MKELKIPGSVGFFLPIANIRDAVISRIQPKKEP